MEEVWGKVVQGLKQKVSGTQALSIGVKRKRKIKRLPLHFRRLQKYPQNTSPFFSSPSYKASPRNGATGKFSLLAEK